MRIAAAVFFVVAAFVVFCAGLSFMHMTEEWSKVAENVNKTFEEYKPKDDVNIYQ